MRKYIAAVLACLSLCALMLPALADSSAPVAENFEFETYRGVSFGGRARRRRSRGRRGELRDHHPAQKGHDRAQ